MYRVLQKWEPTGQNRNRQEEDVPANGIKLGHSSNDREKGKKKNRENKKRWEECI